MAAPQTNDHRFGLVLLVAALVCCFTLAWRVYTLRGQVEAQSKRLFNTNVASATERLDNLSLPQNKPFALCNHSEGDIEVRNFSVAFWNAAGVLRVINALNAGWTPETLQHGQTKNVELVGWNGEYAMYTVDALRNGGNRVVTGTSDSTTGSCIDIN